ncbi:NUDIX domain-containing protein [Candidatus Woesearchaeota archaeon]|nr:NUDIX domain-containing protein [Candidatus Woesearchaeota archaeon]
MKDENKEEMAAIVDENDNFVKAMPKKLADTNIWHRASFIILLNSKRQIYIHRRSDDKKYEPGVWDIAFGGGGRPEESYEDTAIRELREESGIDEDISEIAYFKYDTSEDKCFGKIFVCISDDNINIQKEEIAEGKFIDIDDIDNFMNNNDMKKTAEYIYKNFWEKIISCN